MSFFLPCPGFPPQRCFAPLLTIKGLGKIISHPAGHSVITGVSAAKSRCTNVYRLPAKNGLVPCVCWPHIHAAGFKIQSRDCPLRFPDCRQLGAVPKKRRYSLLAYRRRCPALSRLSKTREGRYSVVLSHEKNLLYRTEQAFVNALPVSNYSATDISLYLG